MANQMIALQARNPQLPDPSRGATQYANMMNMASQQRASQLQGERIRQQMDYATAEEARAAQTQAANMREKDLDIEDKEMLRLYKIGAAILETEDPTAREAGYQNLLGLIEKTSPQLGATMRQVAGTFNAPVLQSVMMETEQYFNKKYPTPTTETAFGPNDEILEVTRGGLPGVSGVRPQLNMPAQGAPAAAPRTPTAPQAAAGTDVNMRATRGANTAPQDLINQGMNPNNIPSGMPTSPASFTQGAGAGQMTPQRAQQIVDTAVKTRVMSQEDFDQMLAMTPEQNKQPFMDMIRSSNITLQPGGMGLQSQFAANQGQRPQAEFAVNRGATPAATLAQTNVVGQQAYGRSGSPTSPAPGVYNVPTQDVAATSRATRPSAGEVYDTELAKIKAARAAGPAPSTPKEKRVRQTEVAKAYSQAQSLIDKTYDPKEGAIALARKIKSLSSDQKEAITGFSGYVPSFRESSREADTLIGNLKGVVTALGKDAAAASGAIGPMAVQEWKIVSDQIANLDLEGMTPRALDAQMDRIIQQVSNATRLAERVYDVQYGDDLKENPSFKLRGAPPPRAKTPVTKAPPGVSATEWKAMTPAERKLWQ